jgi:hypothetical protein
VEGAAAAVPPQGILADVGRREQRHPPARHGQRVPRVDDVNLPEEWADQLFKKGVYESPYMPDTTSTSATDGYAVVGDFKNYVVARRGGMSVELVQHLIGLTNNRPTGQRGWFAYARIGGNSVNDLGFRLLVNTPKRTLPSPLRTPWPPAGNTYPRGARRGQRYMPKMSENVRSAPP